MSNTITKTPKTRYRLTTSYKKLLADTVTPVSIYLRLRDRFANSILLESSDYHSSENSFSYICCNPIARFEVKGYTVTTAFPDGQTTEKSIKEQPVIEQLTAFTQQFEATETDVDFITNGLFGYCSYDAVRYFEEVNINTYGDEARQIPDVLYQVYQFVIAINHFKNELYIFEHQYDTEQESQLDYLEAIVMNNNIPKYNFQVKGEESANMSDDDFLRITQKGKEHCQRGDVFQIVLARRFSQAFQGDEFNVYRALRSINPSPYLFYFDYGSFKIFGSSPEAQLVIKGNHASIHPIAGTFKRTGNDKEDAEKAKELFQDPKENSEHVMLVDLARNDLSRNGQNVTVDVFKEIQFYSHVIHLVSKVTADIQADVSSLKLVADTFPAGTLSGAPKHMAMTLINKYEPNNRGYYGGCIGYLGFNGNFNQAIMIRSFLSKNNQLYYQAGAGIVSKSNPQSELEEVNNKLRALKVALDIAQKL